MVRVTRYQFPRGHARVRRADVHDILYILLLVGIN